jgi:AcrR family transcriptional regulator
MPTTSRAGSRRLPLSAERIAEAALQLIDERGLEEFSMRRLGERLGVEAMALYHYYASRGVLLDAVMDVLVAGIALPSPTLPAEQRLRELLRGWRHVAIEHPHAFGLLAGRRFNSPRAYEFYEIVLQCFAEFGFTPEEAARWFRTLGYFASGAGLADIAGRELVRDATPLTLERAPRSLPYPHVAAAAPHLRAEKLDDVFEFGLEVLFDALRHAVSARSAPRSRTRAIGKAPARRDGGPPSLRRAKRQACQFGLCRRR